MGYTVTVAEARNGVRETRIAHYLERAEGRTTAADRKRQAEELAAAKQNVRDARRRR